MEHVDDVAPPTTRWTEGLLLTFVSLQKSAAAARVGCPLFLRRAL